ncbi:hypothetical protein SB2_06910 [Methylobacterium radiotolerans]|nr:hypothetical protein SB3_08955 [Methylobacterium radiotolerans]KTS49274.1 hypothetical protein SB2_06910 [Methylobacterium radiotolerans]
MTIAEALRQPKGHIVRRVIGAPDLSILGEANYHCTHQNGSVLTLQRMGEVRLLRPPGARDL